jgi:hypothetical protein
VQGAEGSEREAGDVEMGALRAGMWAAGGSGRDGGMRARRRFAARALTPVPPRAGASNAVPGIRFVPLRSRL